MSIPEHQIEVGAPPLLPLGIGVLADTPVLIGLTVQHPPIHVLASPAASLSCNGARAHAAYAYAQRVQQAYQLPASLLEIELATPIGMGLDSGAGLGLAVARALFAVHRHALPDPAEIVAALGLEPCHAAEVWASYAGGLVSVAADPHTRLPRLIQRVELDHAEAAAWAWVLFLPRLPADRPVPDQTQMLRDLVAAAARLPDSAHAPTQQLVAAAQQDDLSQFAAALMQVQQQTIAALQAGGATLPHLPPGAQHGLARMAHSGALAAGRSMGGLAVWGLVQGANASISLRRALRDAVGIEQGRMLATITDNQGVQVVG